MAILIAFIWLLTYLLRVILFGVEEEYLSSSRRRLWEIHQDKTSRRMRLILIASLFIHHSYNCLYSSIHCLPRNTNTLPYCAHFNKESSHFSKGHNLSLIIDHCYCHCHSCCCLPFETWPVRASCIFRHHTNHIICLACSLFQPSSSLNNTSSQSTALLQHNLPALRDDEQNETRHINFSFPWIIPLLDGAELSWAN